jgi:putative membrane protein
MSHRTRTLRRSYVVAITLLACACQKDPLRETRTTSATNWPNVGTPENSRVTTSVVEDDREFLSKAAQGSMHEMQMGQIASRQGGLSSVKSMGDRIAADHSAAYYALQELAARKGVILATKLDAKHQGHLEDISKLSSAKFDKEYASHMVDDHEEDIRLFEKAAKDAHDPDIRAWAEKTLPTLRNHLAMARETNAQIK